MIPRAMVLKTSDRARQGLFESLYHSAAVIQFETRRRAARAAIVGRPVYTVIAGDDAADGQSSTLHFHYLLEEQGGCVPDERTVWRSAWRSSCKAKLEWATGQRRDPAFCRRVPDSPRAGSGLPRGPRVRRRDRTYRQGRRAAAG